MIERFTLLSVLNPITYFQKHVPFLFLIFCLLPGLAIAQPANDDCGNATTITDLSGGCDNFGFSGATADLLNGSCVANGTNSLNTWYQFTAAGSELTINSAAQGGAPMEITVIEFSPTSCVFADATQIACSLSPLTATGLTAGNNYYIVISDPTNGSIDGHNLCVSSNSPNPPPPNDDPCDAVPVVANGSCTNGTTLDATTDWTVGDPACAGLEENSVWYTTTLGTGMDQLEIEVQGAGGNVMVIVGTFAPDCNGTFNNSGYNCGSGGPFTVNNLTENTQYWVLVSSATATEGPFSVCMTESGLPPGCSDNDFCGNATPYPTPTTGDPCTPLMGCNIGANSEPALTGSCNFATEEVVWFSFTSDPTAGLLSASVVANDPTAMSQPSIQVFTGGCGGLTPISDCASGSNGQVTLVNESISPNVDYLVAVSNAIGDGGYFDLCLQTFADLSACATESALYVSPGSPSFGSPDNGPYQPGETVTMCFDLVNYHADPQGSGNNCQWLQGIVPIFGDCWDPTGFDPAASEPPSLYGGNWDWHTNITYNTTNPNITIADCDGDGDTDICHITEPGCCNTGTAAGTVVPPGWFADMGGSPNNTFGDGNCCNCDMGPWSFCFDLVTKQYPECDANPTFTDCSVKVFTFADGETGSWQGGPSICAQDVPQINVASLNCCEGPTVDPQTAEICDGGALFFSLTSNQTNVDYTWTVSPGDNPPNPNQYGAFSGSGPTISQTLTNDTGSPVTVIYSVSGTNTTEGCVGTPTDFQVTIYPSVEVNIPNVLPVCAGECADIQATVSGGSGNYISYEWDQGIPAGSPSANVCPTSTTTYSVTVTDFLGCTGEASVTVAANSGLIINIDALPGTESCINLDDPATVTATVTQGGSGSYGYQWAADLTGSGGSADTEVIFDTDTYWVTITDFITGCTGTQSIDMTINPLPVIVIIDPPAVCESDLQYCFDVFVDNESQGGVGNWGGVADVNGCIDPNALGDGMFQVTYEWTDFNGCYDIATYDFIVDPVPNAPEVLPDVTLCSGGAPQTYTIAAVPGAFSYTWTVPTGATITTGQNTTSITVDWTGSQNGQICVTADNDCGASLPSCFNAIIESAPIAPIPPADVSFCDNVPMQSFSIAAVTGATSYIWTVPAGVSITGGQTTTDIMVNWGTAGSGQVCVTASNACGPSPQVCANVTILTAPAAPTPPADVTICAGATAQVYTVAAVPTATGYTWTVPTGATITMGQNTASITVDWAANATSGEICVTADNGCGSSTPGCFDVTVGTIPAMPTAPANSNVCAGTANSNYAIAPVANATGYIWTVPTGATITNGGNTTSINVDWGTATTGDICVIATNACGDSPQACFTVTVDDVPPAPTAPANAIICAGAQGEIYTVADVVGATSYTWTVPAGASIVNGLGTTEIEVDWAVNATSGQICVTADNVCGMSPQACFDITINDVPEAAVVPNDATICENLQGDVYTIADVPNATGYAWTVPAGASIANGQNSTSIEIDWGATGGDVCVTPSNDCGDGPETCFAIQVNTIPQAPIPPQDPTVCQGTIDDVYAVNPVAGATSYTWTIPADATITNGADTDEITIDWGTAASGQICVTANNDCGASAPACFDVTIDEIPGAPVAPTDAAVCAGTLDVDYSILPVAGANGYTWSAVGGATITGGQNTTNITVDYDNSADATICVTADNDCGASAPACFTTTINPIPTADFTVVTPICNDGTSTITYTGSASTNATYTWNFNGGTNTTGATGAGPYEIEWNAGGTYTVSLTVSENTCESTPVTMDVEVQTPLAVPVINCNTTTSSIEFTWDPIPGATGYLVDNVPNVGTSYEVTGLAAGESVTITVTALGDGPCGDSEATQTCIAEDCPMVDIVIDAVAPICLDANSSIINLVVAVNGSAGTGSGIWSGTGIDDATAGTFDPNAANIGNNAITYTYTEGPCMYSQPIDIVVNNQPTADFTVPSPICAEDTVTINYTGTATATATYDWDFGNADYADGTGAGPYEVHWPAGADQTVTLTVTSLAGCPSVPFSETVVIDAPLAEPNIICNSSTDNIEFTWDAIPGAVEYLVNNISQPGTSYTASGLNAGDMVTITVIAVGNGSCGNSQATQTCTADDCPPVTIDIDPVADICLDASAMSINLNAVVSGAGTGQWSGPGIEDATTGLFNPNAVSVTPGPNTITYNYVDGACTDSETIDIVIIPQPTASFTVDPTVCQGENVTVTFTGTFNAVATYVWDFGNGTVVNDLGSEVYEVQMPVAGTETITLQVIENNCASEIASETVQVDAPLAVPVITCETTTTSITFSWDAIPGANGYTVNSVPQGGTSFTVSGLNSGDMETITVVALGTGACGNSEATQTCTAEDCPNTIDVTIDPAMDLCIGDGTINLNAVVTGGNGGSGLWNGPGITDQVMGTFDPNAMGVLIGANQITYTYSEPPCNYPATIDIIVNDIPSAAFTMDAEACTGQEVTVSLDGAPSGTATYNWNFGNGVVVADLGQESYTLQFPVGGSQDVSLEVINNGCNSGTQTESIQIDEPLPLPNITCSPTLNSVNFTWDAIPGVTEYIVNNVSQTDLNFEFTGLAEGDQVTVTVVAVGNGPCGNSEATETCEASACPPVNVTIDPVGDICETATPTGMIDLEVTITGSNGTGTGSWSGAGIVDAATGMFNPDDPALNNGLNTVTYSFNEDGCDFSDSEPINVFDLPAADAGNPAVLSCLNNNEATLSGSGSGTPMWSGGTFAGGENTYNPTVTSGGTFTLTVTDPVSGCTNTATVEVTIDPSDPMAVSNGDLTLNCNFPTVTLQADGTVGGGNIVTWSGPATGITAANMNDETIVLDNANQAGSYSFTITNPLGCESPPAFIEVDVDLLPPNAIIQVDGALTPCLSTGATLTTPTIPGTTVQWEDPEGTFTNGPILDAITPGTYILYVTDDINGCVGIADTLLEDNVDFPFVDIGDDQVLDCTNPTATIGGPGTQVGPTITYLWTGPAGGIVGPIDESTATAVLAGTYTLLVTETGSGCNNEETVIVVNDINAPVADAGDLAEFGCADEVVSLSGSGTTGADTYEWTDANGTVLSNSVDFDVTEAGTYYLYVLNSGNDCDDLDSVIVNPATNFPTAIDPIVSPPSCFGDSDGFINIAAVIGGTAPYTYSIDGETFNSFSQFSFLEGDVTYDITVEDADGCIFETALFMPQPAPLDIIFNTGADIDFYPTNLGDGSFTLNPTYSIPNGAIDTLLWSPIEFLECPDSVNCFNPSIDSMLYYSTTYSVTMIDTFGCSVTRDIFVEVNKDRPVYIPNAFSPNGDGSNDLFLIFQGDFDRSIEKVNYFRIFNRWGEIVHEAEFFNLDDDEAEWAWDGTFKGQELNPGVFVYVTEIEFVDGFKVLYKGDVTIKK